MPESDNQIGRTPGRFALRASLCAIAISLLGKSVYATDNGDADIFFASRHSVFDVRSAGLARSGAAIPGGIASAATNPALPRAFADAAGLKGILASTAYGRQPVFSRHAFAGAAGLNTPSGLVGVLGRFMDGGEQRRHYDATLVYSGRMFDKSVNQGAVDFGVSVQYQKTRWMYTGLDTLYNERFNRPLPDKFFTLDTVWQAGPPPLRGELYHQRVLLDIGFYQARIADNLDFGLVLQNAFGYSWQQESPVVKASRVDEEFVTEYPDNGLAVEVVDQYRIEREYEKASEKPKGSWFPSRNRALVTAVVFHTPVLQDKLWLLIPADIEVMGLFDRSQRTRFMFRGGLEGIYKERVAARFGYAREPQDVLRGGDLPKYSNNVTAGAGLIFSPVEIDIAVGKNSWMLGVSLAY